MTLTDMRTSPQAGLGATVQGLDVATATAEQGEQLRRLVHQEKIVVLKDQDLTDENLIALGRLVGDIESYYEPMYHHPEHAEIFVSSNVPQGDKQVGVPKTGKFWHADYQFMARPFGITVICPRVVPTANRGTYFIDMGQVWRDLPADVQQECADLYAEHSVRRFFKIRPEDVYRPVGELLAEIETRTPDVRHPLALRHPATGETVLYISEGFTSRLVDADGAPVDSDLLHRLLELSGQLDSTFSDPHIRLQTFDVGDVLVWDNRSLVHRALHTTTPEPAVSHRVTVHDQYPFAG